MKLTETTQLLRNEKKALECKIMDLILEFQDKTDASINYINLVHASDCENILKTVVRIDIEIGV
jgi:hypothetical protein